MIKKYSVWRTWALILGVTFSALVGATNFSLEASGKSHQSSLPDQYIGAAKDYRGFVHYGVVSLKRTSDHKEAKKAAMAALAQTYKEAVIAYREAKKEFKKGDELLLIPKTPAFSILRKKHYRSKRDIKKLSKQIEVLNAKVSKSNAKVSEKMGGSESSELEIYFSEITSHFKAKGAKSKNKK